MLKPTIYEALALKLGRAPTNAELKADVERIKTEALIKLASKGKLPFQRRVTPIAGRSKRAKALRIRCDQCEIARINGVLCHETGCPNMNARYDADSGEWIKQRECFYCGCTIDADDPCCSGEVE